MISLLCLSFILAERIASQTSGLAFLRGRFAFIELAGTYRVAQVYPSVQATTEVLWVVKIEVDVTLVCATLNASRCDTGFTLTGILAEFVSFSCS